MSDQTWIGIPGPGDITFFNLRILTDLMLRKTQKQRENRALHIIGRLLIKYSGAGALLNGLEYCREWFTGKTGLYMKMKQEGTSWKYAA